MQNKVFLKSNHHIMEKHNQHKPIEEKINPVSRKTNEEIDEDESGNLIIGGEVFVDKSNNEDKPLLRNNLSDKDKAIED